LALRASRSRTTAAALLRLFDYAADGVGDRHIDTAGPCPALNLGRGEYALGNMAERGLGFCDSCTLRNRQTDTAVTRQIAGAGQNQVTLCRRVP